MSEMSTVHGYEQGSNTHPKPVFIYGTLCAIPLLAWALTGDSSQVSVVSPLIRRAKVDGFARYRLSNRDYPAAVRCEGSKICGYLVTFSHQSQRRKLDDFEGAIYQEIPVQANIVDQCGRPTGETVEADMYLWNGSMDGVTGEPWDLDEFIAYCLSDWLEIFDGMELIGQIE